MRGKKAKKLREIAYQGTAKKYSHNREYDLVESPKQYKRRGANTIIADEHRYLYQALKGRRVMLDA